MASNTIRFTGLASGMDTESIVKAMLTAQQSKIDKQIRKQQKSTWKQEAWKEMNSKLSKFQEKYIHKLRLQTTFVKSKATSSNDTALSVGTNSIISAGKHEINIEQLATNAYLHTDKSTATVKQLDGTMTLQELGIHDDTTLSIKVGESETTTDIAISKDMSLNDLKDQLQSHGLELTITGKNLSIKGSTIDDIEVKSSSDTFFKKLGFTSSDTLKIAKEKTATGSQLRAQKMSGSSTIGSLRTAGGESIIGVGETIEFTINGKTDKKVVLNSDSTIEDMIKQIKDADPNLAVSYDSGNGQFFISSTISGEQSKIDIVGGDAKANKLANALGLADAAGNALAGGVAQGHDAKYTYNGMALTASSNTVKVNGIEMTFKQEGTGPVTIQGSTDTEGIVSFLKEFVNEYNTLLEDINTKLSTKTKSSYQPLTDEEKDATSDKNVEKIEQYVKDGLFYRDADLMNLRDTLQNTFNGVFEGNTTYKSLYSIGITTGDWKENGKLHIDEEKLTKALTDNLEEVTKLFTATGTETEDQGIFTRINDNFKTLSKSVQGIRSYGSFYNDKVLTDDLLDIADRIYTLNTQYNTKETALYKKFTAMEKMMSQLNTQQSYLTSMLTPQ